MLSGAKPMNARMPGKPKKHNIVIVDGCRIQHDIMARLFREIEANVTVAMNGQEAVKMVADQPEPFDLIFMEIDMPVMDGIDTTAAIRLFDQSTPIIICTTFTSQKMHQRAADVGADDFITKPIDSGCLDESLKTYLKVK
jgi:CheY-like chemotaxis protein